MSKYASGTSMKTVITSEIAEVEAILRKSNLCAEDKKTVIDAMKEMAYQWCSSNASACAMETAVANLYGEAGLVAVGNDMIKNGVRDQKMSTSYPFA